MSFNNPTAVKIGMTGTFSGITYQVIGRVVMGVVEDGQTYYWNEFNLKSDSGQIVTLVYEVTEHGGEWRWFTMFEPQAPITSADAATKRIGDPVNLDGTDVRVTLLDHSHIYYIEGEAPESEEVGDDAQYFNAESGRTMIVVSWTGEEVECYHGETIGSMIVARAFNLPAASLAELPVFGANPGRSISPVAVLSVLLGILFCVAVFPVLIPSRSSSVANISAPPAVLKLGSVGKIDGTNYTITADALVEIHEMNAVAQRHEFHLRDENGNGALLIHGWNPGANDWCLLTSADNSEPMTPQQAAAIPFGKIVSADGVHVPVNNLFNSITLKVDTQDILQSTTGKVFYGFSAESGTALLLARWNEDSVTLQKGQVLHIDVPAAFRPVEK